MKKLIFAVILFVSIHMEGKNIEKATLGAGCFWCVEAVFDQLEGVISVESGYMGGASKNPTYKEVCTGETGHAEVAQITYDADVISFGDILAVFWTVHDPTSLNRQGGDVGTQYRSVIFYHSDSQKNIAKEQIKIVDAEKLYDKPIVTEVSAAEAFYIAENYHQEYYENNKNESYCQFVVRPKVEKFQKMFKDQLKK
ncbi:peptide-methionine (S)-S-oxide reductase MsrA [Saccharicrinis aurantiacus]|uniref:peptide-methionine (S)-S-oxide reductase MsrA n=1 Tax=Saccharicrinis aurantiacus TaxID=1849719 RepID=UPI00248F515D|nr:peptide-methionine (S)-S-oxide reductase MsrA [Saccharicrinis aurantiacus]